MFSQRYKWTSCCYKEHPQTITNVPVICVNPLIYVTPEYCFCNKIFCYSHTSSLKNVRERIYVRYKLTPIHYKHTPARYKHTPIHNKLELTRYCQNILLKNNYE